MTALFREGLAAIGRADSEVATTEVEAVQRLLVQAGDGDVVAVMPLPAEPPWESLWRARRAGRRAGGHPQSRPRCLGSAPCRAELEALWAEPDRDPDERIAAARLL